MDPADYVDGLESLWDSEVDSADADERRELIRADRAQTPWSRVAHVELTGSSFSVSLNHTARLIHVRRFGATWFDGSECGSTLRSIIPAGAVTAVVTVNRCLCAEPAAASFPHVTIGAVLRELERTRAHVTVVVRDGGFRGVVSEVWKDAIGVRAQNARWMIPLGSLVRITTDWS